MANTKTLELITRMIREKHGALIKASIQMLRAITGENEAEKKAKAQQMLENANSLRAVISTDDVPNWLAQAIGNLSQYIDNRRDSYNFLNHHIQVKSQMEAHTWVFEEQSQAAFDFDSIYEHFKKESRLPELFDQIVNILEEIESSGQIDSVTMLKSLGKVIATIKRGKDGSYFSINSAWEFLLSFLKNYMFGELSKIPVLGTMLEALEKTIKETNEEMSALHKNIQEEMSTVVESEIKALKNKSEFNFITYTPTGSLSSSLNKSMHSASA